MDNLEIAKALFGQKQQTVSSSGQTTTAYGVAVSDSADGIVRVNLGGDTVSTDDDQTIEVETTFFVKEGDEVIVSLIGADGTGKAPVVIGVVGRGDEQQREINSVMNYFWTDQYGAHVSTLEHSVEGANVLLDSDSLDIRVGASNSEADQTIYASFGREVTVGSRLSGTVGNYSQVFGYQCLATNNYAHAEGYQTQAKGDYSHSEGAGTKALADYSHTEGDSTQATSWGAHAEGNTTTASGQASHAEGFHSESPGTYSHAEGAYTKAVGTGTHAEGRGTYASGAYSHVQGKYNVQSGPNLGNYIDVIGNGSDENNCHNAYEMDYSGNAEFAGEVYVGGCTLNSGETPYPVVRYNTSSSQSEYYNKGTSAWVQVPGGGGGGAAWGSITGTLSSQTDLQNALNAKQNSLTNTDAEIQTAVSQSHTHSNKAILDTIPSSGTTGYVLKKTSTGTAWQAESGGGGGSSWTSLWTNSDPSSNFSAQTVPIDLSNWNLIAILAKPQTTGSTTSVFRAAVGTENILSVPNIGSTQYFYKRNATVTTSGITFSTGYRNTNGTTGAGYCIPTAVYGIC